MKNLGLPTKEQWSKIATAGVFSFLSGFLASITAQGGINISMGWTGVIALVSGAVVSGINMALYTVYTTFFKSGK